jgi:aspartyl-tRNA synthetase
MIFVLSGPSDKTRGQLSALRMELATRLGLRNPAEFALWVVDFPLLELDEESGRWHTQCTIHFSKPEDMALLATNPGKVRANAYDMVLNGNEIGGGSIRIHDKATQQLMFKYLGFTEKKQKAIRILDGRISIWCATSRRFSFWFRQISSYFRRSRNYRDFIAFQRITEGML